MNRDLTHALSGLQGEQYVTALRALAIMAKLDDGFIRCGGEGCPGRAEWIGMQRCGAPGGPVCEVCVQRQSEWMTATAMLAGASPYCRHCQQDADREHIYVVNIWTGEEQSL